MVTSHSNYLFKRILNFDSIGFWMSIFSKASCMFALNIRPLCWVCDNQRQTALGMGLTNQWAINWHLWVCPTSHCALGQKKQRTCYVLQCALENIVWGRKLKLYERISAKLLLFMSPKFKSVSQGLGFFLKCHALSNHFQDHVTSGLSTHPHRLESEIPSLSLMLLLLLFEFWQVV